ncbi:LamG-like jellyroll fold domain-containing protein [Pedobacter nutrimenti]|uniref:LamG-like jellyroll fold domain-containing protein n=1 Tax=Pedobacter nutrimenti TaxID=1241337 RepID=UPI00292E01F9|nr:LamG-like jellyroll fold domain-containing protein [Pedobacter nutrimenti]
MKFNRIVLTRVSWFCVLIFLSWGFQCTAQTWMAGFSCRKKITFNKNKIEGKSVKLPSGEVNSGLLNFPVLISLEGPEFKFDGDSFDPKISNVNGLDIAFADAADPAIPLNIQLDHYDPVAGKLTCWVQLPFLVSKESITSPSAVYFYYGAALLHDPDGSAAQELWRADYRTITHLNEGNEGKIGQGLFLKENLTEKRLTGNTGTEFFLSAWVWTDKIGPEQMIMTNDSTGKGGYQLKLSISGNLVLEGFYGSLPSWSLTSSAALSSGMWHYIAAKVINGEARLYIDGATVASKSSVNIRLGIGGQVFLGASKQSNLHLSGRLDEVRIGKTVQTLEWIKTEYENQNNPAGFYNIGTTEFSPLITSSIFTFVGGKNTFWDEPANWDKGITPSDHSSVRIKEGKTVELHRNVVLNKLLLEKSSALYFYAGLELEHYAELQVNSGLFSGAAGAIVFRLKGSLENNGEISLVSRGNKIVFSGGSSKIIVSGTGKTSTAILELDRLFPADEVSLEGSFYILDFVDLIRGRLYANGWLVFLSSAERTAALAALRTREAEILGDVQIQCFIAGGFPAPSSGRGWRLLSSPVCTSGLQYSFYALKNRVFITGPGGALNGFDPSSNNAATLYNHDQHLPGTLSQKYLPIPNMQTLLPLGKGFFMFSRGDRTAPDAYSHQVQNPPFSNASSYVATYSGRLFTGRLAITVYNEDSGQEGDGFNLLGNPYAAAIRWGSIYKENIGPYVWLYDPLNGAYKVSDDPDEVIPVGSGFFIKVLHGFKSGSIVFDEDCKIDYR